jgi:hypothetical protein
VLRLPAKKTAMPHEYDILPYDFTNSIKYLDADATIIGRLDLLNPLPAASRVMLVSEPSTE